MGTEYRSSDGAQKIYTTKDAVIASGQSLSGVIDLEQLNITGFLIPASWTTAKLTFQISPDGTTFGDLLDASGNEIQLIVSAGKFIGVNLSELSGARFIKVRSGTSGTPVNQAADRTINIVMTNNAESGGGAAKLSATGGWTPFKVISAATTNATSVKPSAGQLGGLQVFNNSGNIGYLKLYDKASVPTVGTDTPVKTLLIPASTNGAGFTIGRSEIGTQFLIGIALAITGGIADNDNTAVAANAFIVTGDYN